MVCLLTESEENRAHALCKLLACSASVCLSVHVPGLVQIHGAPRLPTLQVHTSLVLKKRHDITIPLFLCVRRACDRSSRITGLRRHSALFNFL